MTHALPPVDLPPGAPVDLHLHSTRSDGTLSPEDLLRGCAQVGLALIAITDHDRAVELPPGEHELDGHRLRLLGGAEVSGVYAGREYHLLVYFPGEVPAAFRAFCQEQCRERATRYQQAVGRLHDQLDVTLLGPDADATRGDRALTRLHLAQAMAGVVRRTYARWADEPIPALNGQTPRRRSRPPPGSSASRACCAATRMARHAWRPNRAGPKSPTSSSGTISA